MLEREKKVVQAQSKQMECGRGVSFWPKPLLHSCTTTESENANFNLVVKPCGFCNRSYHYNDIVVTSCEHTYHPFFLAKIILNNNKCLICGEILHPDWWTSWGFYVQDEDIRNLTLDLGLSEVWKIMTECLLDVSSAPILPSEFLAQTCSIFAFELNYKVDKILDLGFNLHHLKK